MKIRSKKTIVPAALLGTALVVGGGVLWATASGDELDGDDRDRASQAALAEVGAGTVTDASAGDDADDPAYEVEVTRRDGSEVDVALDEDFAVVFVDDDRRGEARSAEDRPSAGDDRALTGDVKAQAEAAAVAAVGGGTVVTSEADDSDDDRGVFEVLVRAGDGTLWQVELDEAFTVVDRDIED